MDFECYAKNSNADNFINSLNIEEYSYSDFSKIFDVNCRFQTEKIVGTKTIEWLKNFYILCSNACDVNCSDKKSIVQNMKQTSFIRSTAGNMFKPSEIYILPVNTALVTKTTPIVKQELFWSSDKSDLIKKFFQDDMGIREYGPKIEIEKLLQKYTGTFGTNNEYFKDLLTFAKYNSDHDDIDFSSYKLFKYLSEVDDELYNTKASNLFLGKVYGNDAGELLANAYKKNCLWNGYAEHYKEGKELQLFITFAVSCGVAKELEIIEQDARDNPLYFSILCNSSKRNTEHEFNSDYTIRSIDKLLEIQSAEISKLIWNALERYGRGYKYDRNKYVTARYSPNGSAVIKSCDSTLFYYLKEYAWIPDNKGRLRKPEDISIPELRKDFVYTSENLLLEALKLGSAAEKLSQKQVKAKKAAEEAGMHAITEEDYQ